MGKTHHFVPHDDADPDPGDSSGDRPGHRAEAAGDGDESVAGDANQRAARARSGSPFLNNAQAAFYIGLHWRTLENMRARGEGPRWRKHGRYVRYHIDDLDTWSRTNGQKARRVGPSSAPEPTDKGGTDA